MEGKEKRNESVSRYDWGNLKRLIVGMVEDIDRGKIPTETCVKNKIYVRKIPSKPYLIELDGVGGRRTARQIDRCMSIQYRYNENIIFVCIIIIYISYRKAAVMCARVVKIRKI